MHVLDKIGKDQQIPIWIDERHLSDEGISADASVTLEMDRVPLRTALRLILEPLNLTYVIEDDVLKITTTTAAKLKLYIRRYSVRDLIAIPADRELDAKYQALEAAIQSSTSGRGENLDGEGGTIRLTPEVGLIVVHQTQIVHREIEGLLTAIRKAKRNTEVYDRIQNETTIKNGRDN